MAWPGASPTRRRTRLAAIGAGLVLGIAVLPSAAKWAALAAIAEYQAEISPLKGYHCAYGTLHGPPTCSAYAKKVIRERGLWQGARLIRQRFRECQAAAALLGERRPR